MASKWRVNVALDESTYDVLRRVAAVQRGSMSGIVRDLVAAMAPGLEQLAVLGEAMAAAEGHQKEAIKRAMSDVDARYASELATAMELVMEAMRAMEDAVHEPPLGNTGVR
jgi:hypothetical protein